MQQALTIGEVAKAADVGIETVRFYEREGLIAEPPRRQSGYRQYPPDTVRRLRFIRRAKDLGFTLKEIGELLDLRVDPTKSCAEVRTLAKAKMGDIEAKMLDLARNSGRADGARADLPGQGTDERVPYPRCAGRAGGRTWRPLISSMQPIARTSRSPAPTCSWRSLARE